jgi:hypothetical protein
MPRLTRAVPTAGWFSDIVNGSSGRDFGTQIVLSSRPRTDGQSTPEWPSFPRSIARALSFPRSSLAGDG